MKIKTLILIFLIILNFEKNTLANNHQEISDEFKNAHEIILGFSLAGILASSILIFDKNNPDAIPFYLVSNTGFILSSLISGSIKLLKKHSQENYYDIEAPRDPNN